MLVLARKKNEDIIVGNGLAVIKTIEIRGDKVRLGVEAPPYIPVHRAEVYREKSRDGHEMLPYIAVPLPQDRLDQLIERANTQGVSVEHLASLLIGGALEFRLFPGEREEYQVHAAGDDANHADA